MGWLAEFCLMESSRVRERRVAWGLTVMENIAGAPTAYERKMLDNYVRGILTLEEVIILVESRRQADDSSDEN